MKVLIDNGHGRETPGKRSPDGKLLEWQWTRDIASRLANKLQTEGIPYEMLVPESHDVPLRERVRRANAISRQESCLIVSIHANASGMGQWMLPSGWSAHVAPNASEASKRLATLLCQQARELGARVRSPAPSQPYWTQSLAICRDTIAPAVLTENMFMDNPADCAWMLTESGKDAIASIHARAIKEFLKL